MERISVNTLGVEHAATVPSVFLGLAVFLGYVSGVEK